MSTPTNFLAEMVPGSMPEAVNKNPSSALKMIAKAAFMQYLASFFDHRGINYPLLKATAPSLAGMYDAGQQTLAGQSEQYRLMQIARLFDGTKAALPSILITDSGGRIVPTGAGSYDGIHKDPATGQAIIRSTTAMKLGLNMAVGAEDLDTAETICNALGMVLGPTLRRLGGGDMITPGIFKDQPGEAMMPNNWTMHLPMGEINIPAAQHNPFGEDPRSGFYTSVIDLSDVYIEASTYFGYDPAVKPNLEDLVGDAPGPLPPKYPATIAPIGDVRLDSSVRIVVRYMPVGAKLYVSDKNIASIRNGFELVPKRPGSATVRLLVEGQGSDVVAEQPFTVTWR